MKKLMRSLVLVLLLVSTIGGQPVLAANYDLNAYVYNHLKNWDTEFEIPVYESDDAIGLVQDVAKKDDYLNASISRIAYERRGDEVKLSIDYKTTKEQEGYISEELTKTINSLITNSMSDLDKVKVINRYLIDRFEYDYSLASNNAYTALSTGKTACKGYAMTAFKMLNLAGIENRIIIGKLDGVGHAWNLVKLNGKWYHLDVTNNDSLGPDKFLMKNDNNMKQEGFSWETSNYPTCAENYNLSLDNTNILTDGQPYAGYKSNIDGNWDMINNSWFFTRKIGVHATGWNIIDGNWYYLGDDGVMKSGWMNYNGKWYYCYPVSGKMATNTVINGYRVDASGEWVV